MKKYSWTKVNDDYFEIWYCENSTTAPEVIATAPDAEKADFLVKATNFVAFHRAAFLEYCDNL
jgi:hypothetical protein